MDKRKKVQIIGAVVIVIGLLAFVAGASAKGKVDQLSKATALKTGEAAQRANAAAAEAGFVAVRGRTVCDEPLTAPISGRPCLSYSCVVDAEWTEVVADKKDASKTTKEKKTKNLSSDSKSVPFAIDDGSGAVRIAAEESSDIERTESPTQSYVSRSSNEPSIMLGNVTYKVSGFPAGTRFTATERVLAPTDALFACGQLGKGALGSSSLILSTQGKEELIASNESAAAAGSGFGWLCIVGGALTLAWGLFFVKSAAAGAAAASPAA